MIKPTYILPKKKKIQIQIQINKKEAETEEMNEPITEASPSCGITRREKLELMLIHENKDLGISFICIKREDERISNDVLRGL
jgi:hypothetical protein